MLDSLASHALTLDVPSENAAFMALTTPLRETLAPFASSVVPGVPGSQRAVACFEGILRKWTAVERWFCSSKSYADAIEPLRKAHANDATGVLDVCRSHEQLRLSTFIVMKIISAIDVGSWLNPRVSGTTEKHGSYLAGMENLIAEIGAMEASHDNYAEVAYHARKLLMQESLLSVEERKEKVKVVASKMTRQKSSQWRSDVTDLLGDQTPMVDILFPLLKSSSSDVEMIGLVEVFIRRLYQTFAVKDFVRDDTKRLLKFSFLEKESEGTVNTLSTVTSLVELTRVVSSGSLNKMDESSDGDSDHGGVIVNGTMRVPPKTVRTGVCVVFDDLKDLLDSSRLDDLWKCLPKASSPDVPVNVLYFLFLNSTVDAAEESHTSVASNIEEILSNYHANLRDIGIRGVTFVLNQEHDALEEYRAPAMFTYRFPSFSEIALYRGIDPIRAPLLDLGRVTENFHTRSLGARLTAACQAHLYEANPRKNALAQDPKASKSSRIFVRVVSFVSGFTSAVFERILVDSLNALDLCTLKKRSDNHVFINVETDSQNCVLDAVNVEQVVAGVLKLQGERITTLGVAEVESRIVCRLSRDSLPIALRLVASNPTGYVHVMSTYVEASAESGKERVFKLIGGTKASLASTADSSWEGQSIQSPYPLTRPFDAQRKAALKSSDTLYAYDLPALIEAAIEEQWEQASEKGGIEGDIRAAARPAIVMQTTELVVRKKYSDPASPWSLQDYFDGKLELVQERRGAGMNDVGMIAWLIELKTVEYPMGREIVLIANDITFKAGSFGTREDVVFKLASEYSRARRIPRLYAAANAGARIGLAEGVKKLFRVAFKEQDKPESGFDFLYVTKEDNAKLGSDVVLTEPATLNGEDVYRITDIIGHEPDLGVENLRGSGLIAGETSAAYDDIFTMTIVLGRSVGIGAYLVRLGQRTIQRENESPIILTGYQALNKLMGVEVYSTNDQLGGPAIMHPNGISHIVEADHFRAIKAAAKWLSFVPSTRGGYLPIADIRGLDTLDRAIGFTPVKGTPYDPRHMLSGGEDDNGVWQSGFFDKGSFVETLSEWAKAVVVGRARLGGIPMGVIVTENRTVETVKPADPADVKASESIIREAGGVWFPNSAYKTATAIKDFKTEDLPLMIFANWRGFSGGQRDMFDEVLKYGSMIVDAFVAYEQPIFVFIPPHGEIRGGAWVVLDPTINEDVMEMYACKESARGGVLEANGTASVKYRTKDLVATMHRLDDKLKELDVQLSAADGDHRAVVERSIKKRENSLLPVYEQIAVRFCELHDTPGRMKAVGAIAEAVAWKEARSFFYWRLRRKLAEFDLRRKVIEASKVGRHDRVLSASSASKLVKEWYTSSSSTSKWEDDKVVLSWMAENNALLEQRVLAYSKECVGREVLDVLTRGGMTGKIGTEGIIEGLRMAMERMAPEERNAFRTKLKDQVGL